MRIKLLLAGSMVVLSLLVGACGGQSGNSGGLKIGFLLKTMQEERYKKDRAFFIKKAESLGVEVIFDSCGNNARTQLSKFENMLTKGVKVIVLQPVNTKTAGNLVRLAHKEGVRVVGYDSLLVNGPLDVHVMQDSWAVGRLQGEAMLRWFKKVKGEIKGNVVLIKGQPGDSNANAMSEGALSIIRANKGLKLLAEKSHEGWSASRAMATTENLLTKYNNRIDAFICNNSGLARGVISALKDQKLADVKKVFVAGSDADIGNIRFVAQGIQAVEIFKMIRPLAETAAEIAVKLAKNPKKKVADLVRVQKMIDNGFMKVPTIITPVVLVTRDNIDSTVIKAGYHTRKSVYGK